MATITPTLSAKVDKTTKKSEILIRFCGGVGKVFRGKTGIFVEKAWLSTSKGKFLKDLPTNPEAQKACDKYESLCKFIKEEFAAVGDEATSKKEWIQVTIDKFHHPEKYVVRPSEEDRPKTLLEAMQSYVDDAPNRIQKNGKHVSFKTILHLKQTQKHVTDFLTTYKRVDDASISEVNKAFYDELVRFMYGKGFTLNTVGKHIKNLKAMINALPLAERDACDLVDSKKCSNLSEDIENIYLTESELRTISETPIETKYLDKVRDQFLLLSWTGCRYSDLGKLTKDNIFENENGKKFFRIEQQKTGAKVVIPLFPETERIMEKYGYEVPKPMAGQKFNEYVKDVCKMAGLVDDVKIERTKGGERDSETKKRFQCVSAHTARRSFATNMYKHGFPTLMIMAITGHKTEKAFLTYIKVTKEENAERMLEQFLEQQGKEVGK
jgi:site-specific recombinase XerD